MHFLGRDFNAFASYKTITCVASTWIGISEGVNYQNHFLAQHILEANVTSPIVIFGPIDLGFVALCCL